MKKRVAASTSVILTIGSFDLEGMASDPDTLIVSDAGRDLYQV